MEELEEMKKAFDGLLKSALRLNEIVKEQQQRINKAIEEIEYYDTLANHLDDEIYLDETLSKKLLEILKGVK